MKLIVDPRTAAIWSCSERMFAFSSFLNPLFLNRGSRPTRHDLHWRCSPRTAKDSPHPQVLLSLWILPGAQKYKERNLWAHAGTFLKKSSSSPCRTFEMVPTEQCWWSCQTDLEMVTEDLAQKVNRPYLRTPRHKIIRAACLVQQKRQEFLASVARGVAPNDSPEAPRRR